MLLNVGKNSMDLNCGNREPEIISVPLNKFWPSKTFGYQGEKGVACSRLRKATMKRSSSLPTQFVLYGLRRSAKADIAKVDPKANLDFLALVRIREKKRKFEMSRAGEKMRQAVLCVSWRVRNVFFCLSPLSCSSQPFFKVVFLWRKGRWAISLDLKNEGMLLREYFLSLQTNQVGYRYNWRLRQSCVFRGLYLICSLLLG